MSRRFTLAEAEQMLPVIDRLIRQAVAEKSEYQQAEEELQSIAQRVMLLGGAVVDREAVLGFRQRRDRAAESLKQALVDIQERGCLVKDLDIGLIDFPTLFRGAEVYLCWKMGEPGIRFWHSVDEGFAGRKEIDAFFLDNHTGDTPA
jgi:hypothetical protein